MQCKSPLVYDKSERKIIPWSDRHSIDALKPGQVMVPCRQCSVCRLNYSREWANRIMAECSTTKNNYFLTLTYDDEHLPMQTVARIEPETGEITGEITNSTLRKKDLSAFLKRLRAWQDYRGHQGVRFYGCGEYGDLSDRPHYHVIVFNCPIPDLTPHGKGSNGDPLYISPIISDLWGMGLVAIGEVSWQSAAYVARYVLKKRTGQTADWYYQSRAHEPEFVQMSRRPGIGAAYFQRNRDKILKHDEITVMGKAGAIKAKPPAYFDRLAEQSGDLTLARRKSERGERANDALRVKKSSCTYGTWDLLQVQAEAGEAKAKFLKRSI